MFIFLQPKIQNNTSRRVVYDYYRDTALQFTTYDSIKEYNIVSYKGVREPHMQRTSAPGDLLVCIAVCRIY